MRDSPRGTAPDFTDAFLVAAFFNLLWIFVLMWAVLGFWSVLVTGYGLNYLISRMELRRQVE